MWLLVAAPPISQWLASPAMAAASDMPGMAMPDAAVHCDEHAGHGDSPSPLQPHAPAWAKCGYCDLLGHSPAMSSVAWLPAAAVPSPHRLSLFGSAPRTPRRLLLAAAPRGPPADVNA